MATSVFTTWSDLYDQMLDDLASISFVDKQYRIGSRVIESQDLEDMRAQLKWVKGMKDEEALADSGTTGYGVFQFSNGGRG